MTPNHIPPNAIPEIAAANSNLSTEDPVLLRREPPSDLYGFLCLMIVGIICALLLTAYLLFGSLL